MTGASRLIEEVFNQGNQGALDELVAAYFAEHGQLPPGIPGSREGVNLMLEMMHNAFPDSKATIHDLIAEGDQVAIHITWTGTRLSLERAARCSKEKCL